MIAFFIKKSSMRMIKLLNINFYITFMNFNKNTNHTVKNTTNIDIKAKMNIIDSMIFEFFVKNNLTFLYT